MTTPTASVDRTENIVRVVNAYKSFSAGQWTLQGLNMNVPPGSIYGLLGPSGCGKSTLLQCILGTISLDSGFVEMKINKLTDVGYMPQELCLENTLTIKETFEYYGALYNMSKNKLLNKMDELNVCLQLPDKHSYIKDISGGQGRRVSLAISLMHDPKLIILDEPTVGIDPVLRNDIWSKFQTMVNEHNITIIITTHYIEEAYQANTVGLMRNGVLVEEASPQDILIKHNTETLEMSFLRLCYNQDTNRENEQISSEAVVKTRKPKQKLKNPGAIMSFSRIQALLKKNSRVCVRDYMLLFNLVVLPALQALNLCLCVGVDFKHMPIAYKNDEVKFSDCQNVKCIFNENHNDTLSCNVLNYLASHDYNLIEVNSVEDGEMSLNYPSYMAFLYFPENYTKSVQTFLADKGNYDVKSMVSVHFTKENMLFRNQIIRDVTDCINDVVENVVTYCSYYNPKLQGIPMDVNTMYGKDVKYVVHSIVSIFIAMGAFYFPSIFAVSCMLTEKLDGILNRSMFAGVTALELLSSMFFINTVIIFIQMTLSMLIVYVLFSNPVQITTGFYAYILLVILLGCIGFFFGLLIAGLSTSKIGAVYVITGWSLIQFTLSGAIWPVEGQPFYLKAVSQVLPLYVAGKTMNDIALKGWTLAHPAIVLGTTVIFAYALIFLLVLIVLGRLKKDMWVIQK
ncbi:ABC transporter G family member 23-like [Adelges cooleyi]|uniref:ABC transporter G family member 23-like n=1 Tax=Adelges cooleyi TaxID=133065 RepID=UPI0021804FDD|nr:ABC transporter G family member 23-like [Adelges cooleyi]